MIKLYECGKFHLFDNLSMTLYAISVNKKIVFKITQISTFLVLLVTLSSLNPISNYAASTICPDSVYTNNPCGGLGTDHKTQCPAQLACIVTILPNVIQAAFLIIGSVIVIMIIWAGIKFIMSGGDAKQIEGARKIVTYAIIGLVIVFGSYFIINFIAKVTGVTCLMNGQFGFNLNCQ